MNCSDEPLTSEIIPKAEDEPKCRICYDSSGTLISVCDCSGSIGLVHDVCILDWIYKKIMLSESMDIPECEICHKKYAATMSVGPQKICYDLLIRKVKELAI